jgi:DNA-binding transcriptional regulator YiaG
MRTEPRKLLGGLLEPRVIDAAHLVVDALVHRKPAIAEFSKAACGGKRDGVLPLIDSGDSSAVAQQPGDLRAAPKKGFGIGDKHCRAAYSMLESNIKDAVSSSAYAFAMDETMGQRIKRLREARQWTQGHLADQVGVTVSAVSQWELDQTGNVKLVPFLRLAKVLETDPHYLVFGAGRGAQELSKPVRAVPPKKRT